MKIAYLIAHDIRRNDGVVKKIVAQKKEWERLGAKVQIFCLIPSMGSSILEAKQYPTNNKYIKTRIIKNEYLLNDLASFEPDIVYFRYDTWSITLHEILNKYKVIADINTNDDGEFFYLFKKEKTIKSFLRFLVYKLLRGLVLSKVKGIVTITRELAEAKSFAKYNKPTVCISNSIDTEKYQTIKTINQEKIELFFIGTPNQPWHGVDIVENIADELKDFTFHIVGIDGISRENIYYHGYLQQDRYFEILKKCSICIGSLAMYRNKMYESNSLKIREYIALGFPVILGCQDVAYLDVEQPEWMKIIDTENELDINDIEKFILTMKNYIINDKDKVFVSSSYVEKKRYDFFIKLSSLL